MQGQLLQQNAPDPPTLYFTKLWEHRTKRISFLDIFAKQGIMQRAK